MGRRIGIYLGDALPPNVIQFLSSLSKIPVEGIDLELYGSCIDRDSIPYGFEYFDVGRLATGSGLEKLRYAYHDTVAYVQNSEEGPTALWQITAPQFHAIPVIAAGRRYGVPAATRIPAQKFGEYRAVDGPVTKAKTFALNNIQLRAVRFSKAVVVLSENNRRNLATRGVPDPRLVILPPMLDTDQFRSVDEERKRSIRSDLGIDHDARVVLYVGRLTKLKGMDALLTAARELEDRDNIEFHLVGTGTYSERLREVDGVVAHGFVPPSSVHRYYKAADALLHPSYTEEEGISWTMLEAAATGLPVVARDVENAADASSFVFSEDSELIEYLSNPSEWKPAPYPEPWAIETNREAYTAFLTELTD